MKTNHFKLIALFAVCAGLLAARPTGYGVGDVVSDFKLKNIDGKYLSLSDYKEGKGVILIFDCNTCPVSKGYNERILALNEKFAEKGFPVLAVNSNSPEVSPGDSFEEMVSYAKKKKYTFSYVADDKQEVATAFGASNTPHVFVLKKEGDKFKVAYIGAIDNNARDGSAANKKYVEDAVNALLDGKEVAVTKTKAIGCTIKWKNS
jgi:peroxiredoxin